MEEFELDFSPVAAGDDDFLYLHEGFYKCFSLTKLMLNFAELD